MKHVLTSAGLLALGVTALHAYDPEMTRQLSGRPWTVGAVVRGFYDDNPTTSVDKRPAPGGGFLRPTESFGVELSPSVHLNLPLEQTFISLGYIYSLRWYENLSPHNFQQSHEFNGKLRHQFGPKHDMGVDDSFVWSDEPTAVDKGLIITAPIKTRSGVLHNRGAIEDNIWLTQQFGLSFGYVNNWYDYEQENTALQPFGSRSALLDRIEHLFRADARFQVNPSLVALVGYMFGLNTYTGDDLITPPTTAPVTGRVIPALKSEDRNNNTHYVYVGGDVDITAKLRGSLRIGGQFTDYHRLHESSANPYADASLVYVYMPGSSVDVGVRHTRNATDVAAVDGKGHPTLDQETTLLYAQISHQIARNFTGTLLAQYQMSEFSGGLWDGKSEDLFLIGVNFEYRFNRHLAAELGYNYDMLNSDVKDGFGDVRSYERNRFYIGLRANY